MKRSREVIDDHSKDLIFDQDGIVIYKQGYGFSSTSELSDEEVVELVKEHGLASKLSAQARKDLRIGKGAR